MSRETLEKILDLARWAPSGDNTQPWRFEIVDDDRAIVHGHDTRDQVLYDFDGHASHIAHGALLETARIAATRFGLGMTWTVDTDPEARLPIYRLLFTTSKAIEPDPLLPWIEKRTVQRRPMHSTRLRTDQRDALRSAVGAGYTAQFLEGFGKKAAIAKLLWDNAYIRLTCPEAFKVHREIIEWGARFSKDRIPEQAVGVDPLTARLMRWAMQDWRRVSFLNRYMLGTILPRIQLDVLPAIKCAAHVLIKPAAPPARLEDWVRLGMGVQRMWLTATLSGLHLQPQMTPVIFRWYAQAGRSFSGTPGLTQRIVALRGDFERITQSCPSDCFGFFARVGVSAPPPHAQHVSQSPNSKESSRWVGSNCGIPCVTLEAPVSTFFTPSESSRPLTPSPKNTIFLISTTYAILQEPGTAVAYSLAWHRCQTSV